MNYKNITIDVSIFALYCIAVTAANTKYGLIGVLFAAFLLIIALQTKELSKRNI